MASVHLIGADTVSSAARTIASAASEMNTAAYNMECALERQRTFMDDWLQRFTQALDEHAAKIAAPAIVIEPAPVREEAPEAPITSPQDSARRYQNVTPETPCVDCGATVQPGDAGCGKRNCPHDHIPF